MTTFKWITGSLIALAIIATAYFAVQSYRGMAKENTTLKEQVTQLEADKKALEDAQERISLAVTKNQQTTTRIIERTRETEEQINASPTTTQCVDSPAIRITLDRLRDNTTKGDDPLP